MVATKCVIAPSVWRQMLNVRRPTIQVGTPLYVSVRRTTSFASGTCSGFSSTALATEKIAVFAPMPSVMVATTASTNAGCRRALRAAYAASCHRLSSHGQIQTARASSPAIALFPNMRRPESDAWNAISSASSASRRR